MHNSPGTVPASYMHSTHFTDYEKYCTMYAFYAFTKYERYCIIHAFHGFLEAAQTDCQGTFHCKKRIARPAIRWKSILDAREVS